MLGYHRLTGELQRPLVADLYRAWTQWRNFFQPVMRLAEKTRVGSKVYRRYDQIATPYQRLLDSGQLSTEARQNLQRQYDALSPKKLMQIIHENNSNSSASCANPMLSSAAAPSPVRWLPC